MSKNMPRRRRVQPQFVLKTEKPEHSTINDTDVLEPLIPYCDADDMIWELDEDNFDDTVKDLCELIDKNEIVVNFVVRQIATANDEFEKCYNLYKKFLTVFEEKYKDSITVKCKLQNKAEYYSSFSRSDLNNLIIYDKVEEFQELCNSHDINDLTKRFSFYSLTNEIIKYGAINIFKYLQLNDKVTIESDSLSKAVRSGNLEMIRLVDELTTENFANDEYRYCRAINDAHKTALIMHNNDVADWLYEKLEDRPDNIEHVDPTDVLWKMGNIRAASFFYKKSFNSHKDYFVRVSLSIFEYFVMLNDLKTAKALFTVLNLSTPIEEAPPYTSKKRRFKTVGGEVVEDLREYKNILKDYTKKPLLYYPVVNKNMDMFKYLLEVGCQPNCQISNQPLALAIENKENEMANLLLDHDCDIFITTTKEKTYEMFMWAMECDNFEIARRLAEMGASAHKRVKYSISAYEYDNTRSTDCISPLMMCCMKGQLDLVKWCISKGAEVDLKWQADTNYFMTALKFACEYGHLDIVKYLIEELKCSPNEFHKLAKRNYYYNTPLTHAISSKNYDLIKYLIDHGADRIFPLKDPGNSRSLISLGEFARLKGCDQKIIDLINTYEPKIEVNKQPIVTSGGLTLGEIVYHTSISI